MAYTAEWESLAESLTRLVSSGLDEQETKTGICNAISDQKIELRAFLFEDDEDLPGYHFAWKRMDIPKRLRPQDFDWANSLPIKHWRAGDPNNVHVGWENRKFELLELRIENVNAALQLTKDQTHLKSGETVARELEYHEMVRLNGRAAKGVYDAMIEKWPNGRVPRSLSIVEIEARIAPIVKRLGFTGGAGTDNIRRILGIKKA